MKAVLLTALLSLVILAAHAQVTTNSFEGRLIDRRGQSLPGATVLITNIPTGVRYGTTTDADGRFRIFNANPGGPYAVSATFTGYKAFTRNDLTLQLGANTGFDITLDDDNTQLTEVVVRAERGGDRQGAGLNIGEQAIRQLPTLSRSFQDVTRLTPQASNNSLFS